MTAGLPGRYAGLPVRPTLFHVLGIPIYAYGLSLGIAFIVGAWIAARRASRAGLAPEHPYGAALWAFIGALLGGRLLFIAVEKPALLARPLQWLSVWEGGMIFYGGFAGAVAAAALYARRHRIPFASLADLLAPSIALGHAFVRVGCFFNGCCYGKPASWGVAIPVLKDGTPRQPAQLYEAAAGVLLFLGLLWWERKVQKVRGELVLVYAAAYGAVRFVLELLRDDFRGGRLLGMTISQAIGLAALAGGTAWFCALRRRRPAVT